MICKKIDFTEEYSFLEYSFFVEIRSKIMIFSTIHLVLLVNKQNYEISRLRSK
ncbi:hypothetical protein PEPMIC_00187 [Parvimonas micra ATCC 33270]|uniref:Uncharacterized protein n=1 Tax=Parvimonas micra ATCC 33270 TaxID=411465 RepID=A8SIS1_9FIRM|nr:hypothetical protein PEPMIC_00187 [Parvimonas micra ATCC 33270]